MSITRQHRGPVYRRLFAWLGGFEDGAILRAAFFAMLAGTASVLYVDYTELGTGDLADPLPVLPSLPGFGPADPQQAAPNLTSDRASLEAPLVIALERGRTLRLTGTIDPGAADRFAAEVDARGEYVDVVELDSPGGSVADALQMGALIRSKGLKTRVSAGALCASSCPLVFAGGVERLASRTAAVGVHQVYAAAQTREGLPARATGVTAMADVQKTTALITRHLLDLGIDAAVWLHALETPPNALYFFSPDELVALKLATQLAES